VQPFIHSSCPFPNNLGHIIHFCKFDKNMFQAYVNILFNSAYSHALEKTCPLNFFLYIQNVTNNYIFEWNYHYIQIRFVHLSHKQWFFWSNYITRSCRFFVNNWHEVSNASNKPIVTWFGIQSIPKKFTTNVKTSCSLLDIQKSKLLVVDTIC
jgi:hypothetical protein